MFTHRSLIALAIVVGSLLVVPMASAAATPSIKSVSVGLPVSEEPGDMPSRTKPRVGIEIVQAPGCQVMDFRYANEDGTWKGNLTFERPWITPSAGFGYKGVFVQLTATCDGGKTIKPVGNVVYTRYTLAKIATTPPVVVPPVTPPVVTPPVVVPPVKPAVVVPSIKSVMVGLPVSEMAGDMPSRTKPSVGIEIDRGTGCQVMEFRYANEDGNWKGSLTFERPWITPSAGYGYKGVFVQLLATCDGGKTIKPVGNVVYTRYTLAKIAA